MKTITDFGKGFLSGVGQFLVFLLIAPIMIGNIVMSLLIPAIGLYFLYRIAIYLF